MYFNGDPTTEFCDISEFINDNREILEEMYKYWLGEMKDSKEPEEVAATICAIYVLNNEANYKEPIKEDNPDNQRLAAWASMIMLNINLWSLERRGFVCQDKAGQWTVADDLLAFLK